MKWHRHWEWRLPALATGLAQGPVRDGGTGTHRSFPTGSGLPSPDHAPGLGHLSTLPQCQRDGRASGVPVSSPRSRQEGHLARRHLHYRPATPLELPGTDWGGDPPPRPGMRERESLLWESFKRRFSCKFIPSLYYVWWVVGVMLQFVQRPITLHSATQEEGQQDVWPDTHCWHSVTDCTGLNTFIVYHYDSVCSCLLYTYLHSVFVNQISVACMI